MKQYLLEGRKVILCKDVLQWALSKGNKTKIIAQTNLKDNTILVSTVFIGIENCIFETIIFDTGDIITRTTHKTYEEAEKYHKTTVKDLENEE